MPHPTALAAILCACLSTAVRAETCRASHYGHGDGFHGRRTASGERFDKNGITAAMRTHDWGYRTVTNLSNGRSVRVRVNDFGPARWTSKCIDLSWGAARAIGMGGTAKVEVR